MIKILILFAVILLIGVLVGKIVVVPIYRLLRGDQEGIKDNFKKVEKDLEEK